MHLSGVKPVPATSFPDVFFESLAYCPWRWVLLRLFPHVCGYAVRGRGWSWDFLVYVTTDALNYAITPDPFGGRGEMAMSPPRCALPFSLQAVPQVRAVPDVKREVVGTITCHRDDTGASGRRVSFKLTGSSSSRVDNEQVEYNPKRY